MKKKIVRVASFLMALAMTVSIVGCGKSTKTDSEPNGGVNSSESDSGKSNALTEVRDLEGRTIRFLANWSEPTKGSSDRNNRYWEKKTQVEKDYNCKFEHIVIADDTVYDTFITSILSGTPMADVVCYKGNPYPAIVQGLFYNLASLPEFDFNENKWQKAVSDLGRVNDKQYLMLGQSFYRANLVYYNKDVFNQYGLEDLYTLQKNGELTLDKFVNIATQLSKSTGKVSIRTMDYDLFPKAYGVVPVEKVDNKLEFKVNVNSAKMVDAYSKMMQLINEGVMSNGLDGTSWNYAQVQFNSGVCPILTGSESIEDHFSSTDFEVGMCVFPTVDGKMLLTNDANLAWTAIPYNVNKANDVALIWNQMNDVILDVDYKSRYQDAVSEEAMELIDEIAKLQTSQSFTVNCDVATSSVSSKTGTMNEMRSGAITPAQAMQTIEPLYKAALKAFMEN